MRSRCSSRPDIRGWAKCACPWRWWWKELQRPIVLAVSAYVLATALAPAMAERMMFFPQHGSFRAPDGMRKITGDGGKEIATLYLPNPQAHFTIWYFHGNAEDLGDIEPFLRALCAAGYAVFAFDYPGYGHSGGQPSETTIDAAGRRARSYLRDQLHVPAERTIIYGRSLGGGPATQLAVEERVGGLVLQSAFTSAYRVVTRWPLLPFDQFKNLRKILRVNAPVLIMHGGRDEVIPLHHGHALLAAAHEPKRALWVADAMHNDFNAVAGERLWTALRDFAAVCEAVEASR
jgi:abhydrolase domain-containing protein 17